jgi:hypothetical protein
MEKILIGAICGGIAGLFFEKKVAVEKDSKKDLPADKNRAKVAPTENEKPAE